jgi:stress response protein YsnF
MEKKLVLVEELHVRKERNESHHPQTLKVLKEEVAVERIPPGQTARAPRARAARPGKQ